MTAEQNDTTVCAGCGRTYAAGPDLLAAAQALTFATSDVLLAGREGWNRVDNIGSGEALAQAVDGVRLLIEAMDAGDTLDVPDTGQLLAALVKWLDAIGDIR